MQPLWKTGWIFLKKLKIELLYDPEIQHKEINPKKMLDNEAKMDKQDGHCGVIYNSFKLEAT